jgi:uncharacterized protein (TIGR01777 family)
MNIALTGASGFIGRRVTERLTRDGHAIRAISVRTPPAEEALEGVTAVIHLAGEPVARRWTEDARKNILESRRDGTRRLVAALKAHPPNVLVSASAIGYYGDRGDELLTEASPPGSGFLCEVAEVWENEALKAADFGVRVARLRIGVVLGRDGGALQKMLLPFKLGLGAKLGNGLQWMSWIHIDDVVSLIGYVIREKTLRGVLNATSPRPVTNLEFTKGLGEALHRPAILAAPAFALKLALGEMSEVLLASQRVIPEATIASGFEFAYPDLQGALFEILR